MALSDAAYLEQLKTWRDNIITALKTPETVGAYGGMPDPIGGQGVGRMSGRAQLLAELREVEAKILMLDEERSGWEVTSEMSA